VPQFIADARQFALEAFLRMGIPDFRSENYKYTDLSKLFNNESYRRNFYSEVVDVNVDDVFSCDVPEFDTHLVFLVNGWYYDRNTDQTDLPKGMIVKSFKQAAVEDSALVEKYYSKIADSGKDPLVALNTAFAQDGLFIYIPDNLVIEKPIQIINLLNSNDDLYITQRNLVIAGKNSQAKLMLCDHTLSTQSFIANNLTEVEIGDDAVIDIYSIQNQHNGTANLTGIFSRQGRNSKLVTNTISLHGGLIRNNLSIILNGEHAEAKVCGLALTDGGQHVDNFTYIEHAKPNCQSNQIYKNVLDDNSTGGFTGRIHVMPGATKTEAFQRNNSVLLTKAAKMNTKPQLVIDNDDVKCSHGATVGQVNEEALFYLQSRGINEKEARLMLMFAFAHEVLAEIRVDQLRQSIDQLVNKRLRGEVSRCHDCKLECIR
jgi:Fe-S cluster assembly protein SufD